MKLFGKLFGSKNTDEPSNSPSREDVAAHMLKMAEDALKNNQPERAFATYHTLALENGCADAQYNLAVLYATGRGTEQNLLQAAYWFQQAAESGDENAARMQKKCMMDYIHADIRQKTHQDVYAEMKDYTELLHPGKDLAAAIISDFYPLAGHYFNQQDYAAAAKLFRALAEYANHGMSQNYIAVLHNAGAGIEKNDLAALYWFDRAVDNGAEISRADRDGILNAYRTNLSPEDFRRQMRLLSEYCLNGAEGFPRDAQKAQYWMSLAQ